MPSVSPTNSSRSPDRRPRLLAGACLLALALVGATAEARPVEIAVIHTTDLHGYVLPTVDYDGRTNVGGILKSATLIRQLRAQNPHTLLVDCGDLYQGAPESYLTDGRIMIRALDWLKYDAWALGNHEFDWGLEKMGRLHDVSGTPMIAANLIARPGRPHPFPRVRPYVVREVDGVKVVIVGLITPGVPTWSTPDLLGDSLFERSVPALKRIMPAVRAEEPDVLLLATHQGYKRQGDDNANEINAIVKQFPEFDAIIGGHSHQPIPEAWIDGRVLYTQAGYFGAWLGQLDLTYDTVARRVTRKSARLHNVDETVPRDAELEALLDADLKRAEAYLARPVGRAATRIPWVSDEYGNSPIQRLLARALAAASGAEVVLHGVLDEQDLLPGELRMADIWRIVPYENRVAVLQVTPGELLELLAENAGVRSEHAFMGLYGARYTWAPGGERRPTGLVLADGTVPHPRKRLVLAVNSYAVASGGGRYKRLREISERPESRMRILDIDTRTAVVEYVRKHSPLDAAKLMEDP